jgi:hypothetical protein
MRRSAAGNKSIAASGGRWSHGLQIAISTVSAGA